MRVLPGVLLVLMCSAGILPAQNADLATDVLPGDGVAEAEGRRCALLVVGLPGDADHERLFAETVDAWQKWLVADLAFSPADVWRFSGRDTPQPVAENRRSGTRESLATHIAPLLAELRPADTLWVFFLGHANDDGEHAWFHLPGPDVNERDVAGLFRDVACGEQVFWLTHTCSGGFLEALSAPGRIVITATQPDGEVNETEFPVALTNVMQRPPHELDKNADGKVAIAELFAATSLQVDRLFADDQRAATEHALLDDNGDGHGTERPELNADLAPADAGPHPPEAAFAPVTPNGGDAPSGPNETASPVPQIGRVKEPDGQLAARTFLPIDARPPARAPVELDSQPNSEPPAKDPATDEPADSQP